MRVRLVTGCQCDRIVDIRDPDEPDRAEIVWVWIDVSHDPQFAEPPGPDRVGLRRFRRTTEHTHTVPTYREIVGDTWAKDTYDRMVDWYNQYGLDVGL